MTFVRPPTNQLGMQYVGRNLPELLDIRPSACLNLERLTASVIAGSYTNQINLVLQKPGAITAVCFQR